MNVKTRKDAARKKTMMSRKSSQDFAPGKYQGLSKKDMKNKGRGLGQRTKHEDNSF